MKSERGVSLMSLIIYLIAMTIVIAIVANISRYFYKNVSYVGDSLEASEQFVKFNALFTKEVNIKNNFVEKVEEEEKYKYVIFSKTRNQYIFDVENKEIYMNKVKLCSNIIDCNFSYNKDEELVTVELIVNNGGNQTNLKNTYKICK